MEHVKPQCHTRTLGVEQGYKALHISDRLTDSGTPCMVSLWKPSQKEIQAMMAGMPIRLVVLGEDHPPVKVDIGEIDAQDAEHVQ